MTILDGALQFTGTAGTVSSDSPTNGTTASNNVIDLLNARDLGVGDDPALKILATITAPFAGGTSIQLVIEGAPDNGSGSPGTYVRMATGPAVVTANALAGTRLFDLDLPRIAGATPDRPGATMALPRFLRMQAVIVGTMTAGSYFAAIVLDREDQISYPPGIVIAN